MTRHEEYARWADNAAIKCRQSEIDATTYALLAIYELLKERLPDPRPVPRLPQPDPQGMEEAHGKG